MSEIQDSLFRSEKRIIAVSWWKDSSSVSHLENISYKNWNGCGRGYGRFLNETASKMTPSKAKDCLNWKISSKNLTLQIYPSNDFYYCFNESSEEREFLFRAAIRRAMIQMKDEINLPLNWVAAVSASYPMMATIVISKIIPNKKQKFKEVDKCFPASFFRRDKSAIQNLNYIEYSVAKAFFECAGQTIKFQSRIDDLIRIARKYDFDLPVGYYAFRISTLPTI